MAGLVSGGWAYVFFMPPRSTRSAGCLIALLLLGLFFLMLIPAVQNAHPAARRMPCGNNVKLLQIDDGALTDHLLADFWGNDLRFPSRARPEGYLAIGAFLLLAFLPAFWLKKRARKK